MRKIPFVRKRTTKADIIAADLWNRMMVPKGNEGSLLVSPSMCKQLAENGWLKEFQGKISRLVYDSLSKYANLEGRKLMYQRL